MSRREDDRQHAGIAPGWLVLIALCIGLVYVFLLPPWQQNDEPGQFEYVWLTAHLNRWPQPGDADAQMRREVIASMAEYGFFRDRHLIPNLVGSGQPIDIGVSQLDGAPLYYFTASLPLRLFRHADIAFQFYLARLVSLGFFLAAVMFAWHASRLLLGSHPLGGMLVIFFAMLPQLAYRMTAINDDSAAVAAMTFFLWMSLRGIKLGCDWKSLLGIPAGVALCLLSKPTAYLALPFGLLALLLTLFHRRQKWVWAGTFALGLAALPLAFEWQASVPAYYYLENNQAQRAPSTAGVEGKYGFVTSQQVPGFYQVLEGEKLERLSEPYNRTVTIGAWVWADRAVEISSLRLTFDGQTALDAGRLTVTETPQFVTASGQLPMDYRIGLLRVANYPLPEGVHVYWDCLVLTPGTPPVGSLPLVSQQCGFIHWGGYRGENLIRNPSAEMGWLPLRTQWITRLLGGYRLQSTDFLAVLDPPASWQYFRDAGMYLFRTFWGRFNWGTLPLAGHKPYRLFVVLTVLALLGNVVAVFRYRKMADWRWIGFLLAFLAGGLTYTMFRFAGAWYDYYKYLPQARYFFPAIFAAAFFLVSGWYALLAVLPRFTYLRSKLPLIFAGLFFLYNGWAWFTIWQYWYG